MKKRLLLSWLFLLLLPTLASPGDQFKVLRVIDGDTFVIETGERVRLIGVDAPETVHPRKPVEYYGKEASEFTRQLLERKTVRLEYDWQQRDKYSRLLAYVFLGDLFVNAEIIKQGYGHAYAAYPFKQEYMDQFHSICLGLKNCEHFPSDLLGTLEVHINRISIFLVSISRQTVVICAILRSYKVRLSATTERKIS